MTRIAYTLHWSARWGRGIIKKVLSQVKIWRASGHDVQMFMLTPSPQAARTVRELDSEIPVHVLFYRGGLAGRFSYYYPLTRAVRQWGPELVYHRYSGYYPALPRLARRTPLVFEINTDDLNEYRLGPRYRDWYNRLTRRWLLSQGRGMVFVSAELARKPHLACFARSAAVISNGIDLSRYPQLPPAQNERPHLVFIGSPKEQWHGVDKIYALAQSASDWQFDLVGISAEQLPGPMLDNLHCHGLLERAAYEPLFARADVAIGTLALHRNAMEEASPLKVREYLAFGLPVLIGYQDTDFPAGHALILQLPNTPENVQTHLPAIRAFVARVKGQRVPREAVLHLDVRQKEQQRLAFLRSIIQD